MGADDNIGIKALFVCGGHSLNASVRVPSATVCIRDSPAGGAGSALLRRYAERYPLGRGGG